MHCTGDWQTAGEIVSQVAYYDDTLYHSNGDRTFTDGTAQLEHDPHTQDDGATTLSHAPGGARDKRSRLRRGVVRLHRRCPPRSVPRERFRRSVARPQPPV